jgi:uncharacterized protein (DUF302 family)
MAYYYSRTIRAPFEDAVNRTIDALKEQGFGVLTEIDVKETLRKKLGARFRPYRILGACSPPSALKALQAEDKIGTLLPCNVIVQERGDGGIEVAAINPVSAMQEVGNEALTSIAKEIQRKLHRVIDEV